MYIEIGAFEAKTKLSFILQQVKQGKRFTISVRGHPIADLVPSGSGAFYDIKTAIEDMKNLPKIKGISQDILNDWIAEGRK